MRKRLSTLLAGLFCLLAVLLISSSRGLVSAETGPEQTRADLLREDIINTGDVQAGNAPAISAATRGGALLAEDFDTTAVSALPAGWTVDNVNGDVNAWTTRDSSSQTAPNSARINFNGALAMDDWLISPSFELVSGTDYRLTFYYRVEAAALAENLAAYIGTGAAGSSLTTQIVDLPGNTNTAWEQSQTVFTAAASGTHYLGFHGYSDADKFYNYVDSILLEVNPVGAPECASPVMPVDAATDVLAGSMLGWAASASGTAPGDFAFFFGTDNPPANIEDATALGSATSYTPTTALTYDATYYWQVVPSNGGGAAVSCPVWSFTVQSDPTVTSFPYLETFGDDVCEQPVGWEQDAANSEDWLLGVPGNAANPAEFGADADHTDGAGCIAWIDSSIPDSANPAGLMTPPLDTTALTAPTLEFWYQNQSAASSDPSFSTLAVDVYDGSAWVTGVFTIGAKVTDWTKYTVDLTSYSSATTRVRFSGTEQPAWFDSDISLDDVLIQEAPIDDLAITALVSPASSCALTNAETVTVAIQNLGNNPASDFDLSVSVNGAAQGATTLAGPLAAGASAEFSFGTGIDLSAAGIYTVSASLQADDDLLNNTLEIVVNNLGQTPIVSFPYSESFEGTDGGWVAGGVNSSWERGVPADTSISSAYDGSDVWATGLITDYVSNEQSYVQSPCFDFSAVTDPQISMGFNVASEFSWDGAALQYSTDGGDAWTTVGAAGDAFIWHNDTTIAGLGWSGSQVGWSGSSYGSWQPASHELDALAGESLVILRVAFGSDNSGVDEGFAFDAVLIENGTPTIDALTTEISTTLAMSSTGSEPLTFENVGDGTMSYSIYEGTCATGTDVPWITGLTPSLGTIDPSNSESITVAIDTTGMMAGTYSSTVCVFTSSPDTVRAQDEVTVNLTVTQIPTAVGLSSGGTSVLTAAAPAFVVALLVVTAILVARPVLRRQQH